MHLLSEQTVSEAAYINEAARWADWLTKTESGGGKDVQQAWARLEGKYGLSPQTFWSLRYRKPKTLIVSVYMKLKGAYEAERQRQLRLYQHELQTAQILGADLADLASEDSSLVDDSLSSENL